MTYGTLRFRLTKAFPGVDADLIEGWIADVYSDILGELPWSRQQVTETLVTTAPYTDGTVTVTEGSASITGVGTTFTDTMTGRAFRAAGRDEYYEFTFVDATTGTLDRAYEGTSGDVAYKIFQFIYPLPGDCRLVEDNAFTPLVRLTHGPLSTLSFGQPTTWASYMDDGSTPPRLQVQLFPVPDRVMDIPFTYTADVSTLGRSSAFQAWIEPAALIDGVTAKILRHLKDYTGAALALASADKALQSMRRAEAHGMAPTQFQLPSHYTGYRRRRW